MNSISITASDFKFHHPRYQILEILGSGGMGHAFKAFDLLNGTIVVIKALPENHDDDMKSRLLSEFRLLHDIKHPAVPEVYDFIMDSGFIPFYTMEWIDGTCLREMIRRNTDVSEPDFYSLFFQLLQFLDYANKKNIVHRDLKPENLIVRGISENGHDLKPEMKIIDFGLAGHAREIRTGEFSGTIQYAAPEAIKKTMVDHRSDLYSLGVILYEWLSGNNPFDAQDVVNVVINQLEKNAEPLIPRFSYIPAAVTSIVMKCLNKNPDHRYQNTGEIIRDVLANDELRSHWDNYQQDRAFFLNDSFFDYYDGLSTITQITDDIFRAETDTIKWISIKGDPTSGKSALLNEIKMKYQLPDIKIIKHQASKSDSPFFNINSLIRQMNMMFAAQNSPKHFTLPADYLKIPPEDEDEIEQVLVGVVTARIQTGMRMLMLIDSEHLLSDMEKSLLKNLYNKLRYRPIARIIVIHTSLRGYVSLLAESLPHEEIEIPPVKMSQADEICGHLLYHAPFEKPFSEFLAPRSNGSPFLLKETVRHCLQSRKLPFDGAIYRFIQPQDESLPDSVQSFLIRQTEYLPEAERKILRYMSMFQGMFTSKEIAEITGTDKPEARLRFLSKLGFITIHNSLYQINNPYLHKYIYDSIDKQQRKDNHKALSEYYLNQDHFLFIQQIAAHLYGAEEYQSALPYIVKSGEKLLKEKKYSAALGQYEKAYSVIKNEPVSEQAISVLSSIVHLCDIIPERQKQASFLSELNLVTESSGKKEHRIDYLMLFGLYLERISAYDQSEKVIQEAILIADSIQQKSRLTALYRALGKSYYQRARWQDALVCYQRALSEIQESSDISSETELMNSIGTVYGTLRKWDLAMNTFKRVLELASDKGDEKSRLNALINLGFIAHQKHDEPAALDYYYQAEETVQTIPNKTFEQRLKQYMGISYRLLNRYEKALAYFEETAKLSESLGDQQTLGKVWSEQSVIYHRLGGYSEAVELMEKAVTIAERLNNAKDASVRQLRMAEMLFDTDKQKEALSRIHRAKPYIDAHGDDEWRVYAGWLNMKLSISGDENPDDQSKDQDFINSCDRLIQSAVNNNFTSLLAMLYDLRAEQSFRKGDINNALDYSSKAAELISKTEYFEFDDCPILFRRFQIMSEESSVSRKERGTILEQAYQKTIETEKSLNRSDLKERYHFKPIVKTIREHYRMFFNEEIEFRQESFKVLFEIARTINSILEPKQLFETIMDETLRHSGADRGLVLIRDEDEDSFDIKTARHIEPNELKDVEQISLSIVRDVYDSGEPVVTADAQSDERFRERQSVVAYHIRSIMCVPLKIRDRIVGAVYVDKQFDSNYFNEFNVRFLESFAHLSAIAIENARLYDNLRNEKENLQKENIDLRHLVQEKYITHNIVGRSKPMNEVFRMIDMAATSGAPVIIEGESGTGKELAARAIHFNSSRKDKPFVTVDCGSLTESLLESELFGYKKGAFTGAVTDKKGLFEEADGGTLFLDEISNTSLNFQSKLLRALQEGEIRRVGDSRSRKLDVRVITATNRSLQQEVQQNRFREDLYYRLNVLRIYLPPLRDRQDDIPLLVHFFMQKYNKIHLKNTETVASELLGALTRHTWPGNVREMDNLFNRMILFSTEKTLRYSELPDEMKSVIPASAINSQAVYAAPAEGDDQFSSLKSMEDYLNTVEKNFFNQVLRRAEGNKSKAAEILGIKRTTLNDRLKKLGLL